MMCRCKKTSSTKRPDLGDVIIEGRTGSLKDRMNVFSTLMDDVSSSRVSLYQRQVCSAADREVIIRDPDIPGYRKMLMFGSNNYLGLATHPHVMKRVQETINLYGVGIGGPPLLNGYTKLHRELEERLAAFKCADSAMIFSTGYGTNVGILTGLLRHGDRVICDQNSHASFWDGLKMAGIRPYRFPHNDSDELEALLKKKYTKGETYVGVEGVYSMDGDVAPLDRIASLCHSHAARLLVDDAHGTGVMGPNGKGTAAYFDVEGYVFLQMGTFSKSFGVVGGFVTGSNDIIEYLRYFARTYMFSASLPPMIIAAVLGGLEILEREPERIQHLHDNVAYAVKRLKMAGFTVNPAAAIIVLNVPGWMNIRKAAERFHRAGIFVNAIEYPAVARDEQRFRISMMATHTRNDIDRLVSCISEVWGEENRLSSSIGFNAA